MDFGQLIVLLDARRRGSATMVVVKRWHRAGSEAFLVMSWRTCVSEVVGHGHVLYIVLTLCRSIAHVESMASEG